MEKLNQSMTITWQNFPALETTEPELNKSERSIRLVRCNEYHVAEKTEYILAFSGSSIIAKSGSQVLALPGSKVAALGGATVTAFAASKIIALSGCTVRFKNGANIHKQAGVVTELIDENIKLRLWS